jgi:hypothetical protein
MYLLDSLDLGSVLCVGVPTPGTLSTLAQRAGHVTIACPGRSAQTRAERHVANEQLTNVVLRDAQDPDLADREYSLAVVTSSVRALSPPVHAAVESCAVVYIDGAKPAAVHDLAPPEPHQELFASPGTGEVHGIAPLGDEHLEELARSAAERTAAEPRPGARRVARRSVSRAPAGHREASLHGVTPGPPGYIRRLAEEAGVDLDGWRVALAAPSDDASRKAVLFLFGRRDTRPRQVVKLTRDATYNGRLENEWRALVHLRDAAIGTATTVPRPVFAGHEDGLAVVGQTAIDGAPFRRRTAATAACPLARRTLDWLLDLGAATADHAAHNADIAAALRDLHEQFLAVYSLTAQHRVALASQLDRIEHGPPMPLVVQHGDAGTWNVLITDDGRPAFLDWEAFEARGMPLWDVFYFLRSYGEGVARAAGTWRSVDGLAQQYVTDSPLGALMVDAAERHCRDLGLARELVEPLFHLCWMHRALKEATRLAPDRRESGRYVNLLRLGLDRRDAPTLRRLFGH